MVVHLTVGLPIVLEEAAVDEWREAFLPGGGGGEAEGKGLSLEQGTVMAVTVVESPTC